MCCPALLGTPLRRVTVTPLRFSQAISVGPKTLNVVGLKPLPPMAMVWVAAAVLRGVAGCWYPSGSCSSPGAEAACKNGDRI